MREVLKKLNDFNIFHLGDVKRLETPNDFFQELKKGFINSNEAYVSSMYFGEDDQTEELIKIIEQRNEDGKRTIIILDKARGMTDHIKKMIAKYKLYDNFYFKKKNYSFLPSKISEILSVFHSKVILFDETAIITGANVNGGYFTTRLDRYFMINNIDLVNLIIGTIFIPVIQGSSDVGGYNVVSGALGSIHSSIYGNKRVKNNRLFDEFGKTLTEFLEEQKNPINFIDMLEEKEITTDPKIIIYDERSEYAVIEALVKRGFNEIYIATAYLNLPYPYIKLLKDSNLKILVNDPVSNIFTEYGNHGNLVTDIYKYSTLRTAMNLPNAEIYEFRRDGYSLHTKGIWAFTDSVVATVIGSSNLNRRSFERDDELNFLLLSNDPKHVKLFRTEIDSLLECSKLRPIETLKSRDYSLFIILIFVIFNRFF